MPNGDEGVFSKAKKNGQTHWWKWAILGILSPALGVVGVRTATRILAAWDAPVMAAEHIKVDNIRDSLDHHDVQEIRKDVKEIKEWAQGKDPWAKAPAVVVRRNPR